MNPAGTRPAPWIIRTYAGFGSAEETNARFVSNLKAGQTGLSVAFDLPTQNGYDPDDPMAHGEVGGCGVSIAHLGDMEALFRGIDPATVNTSMTINATAPFLFCLYLVMAERRGISPDSLRGTTQNDLMKEFVARGTSIFDPDVSLRLSTDLITYAADEVQGWNPVNICGYHYSESGALPDQEIGLAFGNALLLLDTIRKQISAERFETVVRRLSFFVNSGIELVPEICKMRAYTRLWPRLCREEYGISGVRFRAGCQVRSISLPANNPENNIVRIALEALPAILSADARVVSLQLPGFQEASHLPDRMEQTLSIRTQQILMHETGIADYPDIFEGSVVIGRITDEIEQRAASLAASLRSLSYRDAILSAGRYLTEGLIRRQQQRDRGEETVVGVNAFTEAVGLSQHLPRPAITAQSRSFLDERNNAMTEWRKTRDAESWQQAYRNLREQVSAGRNVIPPTIAFVKAGGTVGEWTAAVASATTGRQTPVLSVDGIPEAPSRKVPAAKRVRVVLGKAGLDGHTNALKVLSVAFRDAGMEVIMAGTKLPASALVRIATDEDADVLAVSCLSGAHLHIAREIMSLRSGQSSDRRWKFVLGGIIPDKDLPALHELGVDLVIQNTGTPSTEIAQTIQEMVLGHRRE